MYCITCGKFVPEGARFCAGCGSPADAEATKVAVGRPVPVAPTPTVPPYVAPRAHNGERIAEREEQVIFTTRPTLLFIKLGYAAAALGAILLVVLLSLPVIGVSPFVSIPLALALLLIPAFYHLKRNTVCYTLTDSKIEIDRGFISRTTRNIPLRNIQDVTVSTTIPQRLLGFGNLVIENANEQGGTTILQNIPSPRRHADMLLRALREWQ